MASAQLFPRIVSAKIDGRTQNIRYRQTQFHRLQSILVRHVDEITSAIQADSGHTPEEVQAEIGLAMKEIRSHYLSMKLEKDLDEEYAIAHGKDNMNRRRGVGIVYIVPSMHAMFYSVVSTLSAAMASGNCVIIEFTKTTMLVPALLRTLLPKALDNDSFAISEERPNETFLASVIMVSQEQRLKDIPARPCLISSITARTVAIVDRTANITEAAIAVVSARLAFGGRSAYAPDVVLVHEFVMKHFVEAVIQHASRHLAGQNGEARQTAAARMITRRSSPGPSLIETAWKDASARVLISGMNWAIVEILNRDSTLLQSKVNEKVLLVHPVTSLDDAIDLSNSGDTLVATYAFASLAAAKYLTQFIDAYTSWVNHIPTDMLIGPLIPENTTPNLQNRYSARLFEVPRPVILSKTENMALVNVLLNRSQHPEKAFAAWNEALAPLPSTKQRPGYKIGFFEQGLITGSVVTLFTLVATLSTIGYYTYSYGRWWRK